MRARARERACVCVCVCKCVRVRISLQRERVCVRERERRTHRHTPFGLPRREEKTGDFKREGVHVTVYPNRRFACHIIMPHHPTTLCITSSYTLHHIITPSIRTASLPATDSQREGECGRDSNTLHHIILHSASHHPTLCITSSVQTARERESVG